jgi:hypothetical protein
MKNLIRQLYQISIRLDKYEMEYKNTQSILIELETKIQAEKIKERQKTNELFESFTKTELSELPPKPEINEK